MRASAEDDMAEPAGSRDDRGSGGFAGKAALTGGRDGGEIIGG
jgi:hypothetical protein